MRTSERKQVELKKNCRKAINAHTSEPQPASDSLVGLERHFTQSATTKGFTSM